METTRYFLRLTNHGRWADTTEATILDAVKAAKRIGFEVTIFRGVPTPKSYGPADGASLVAFVGPFGSKFYSEAERMAYRALKGNGDL